MAKKKREHSIELLTFKNALKNPPDLKGLWNEKIFKNDRPIILELGCGKADYTLALAKRFPNNNYIGVDRKGARLWRGARTALEENMTNVFFLLILIQEINDYFEAGEVDGIWITFPDPYPKKRHEKHRLTSPLFLKRFQNILKAGAPIRLKTDDPDLYAYSIEKVKESGGFIRRAIDDLYAQDNIDDLLSIKTYYEHKHLAIGRKIMYLEFNF